MSIIQKVKTPANYCVHLFTRDASKLLTTSLYLPLALILAQALPSLAQQTPTTQTPPVESNPAGNDQPGAGGDQPGAGGDQQVAPQGGDRTLNEGKTILSIEGGKKLMEDAKTAINSNNYEAAASNLQKARQVFNQLTNFYLDLSKSFNGIDNRISEEQSRKAAEAGQMRDEATYQLALVHRAQNKPELSVPLLIQVIRSQNPSSDLGKRSYQQLYELGFVNTAPTTSTSNQPPANK